ncbi:hypothetical protein ACHAXT_001874 [Thalassiosira profunda]
MSLRTRNTQQGVRTGCLGAVIVAAKNRIKFNRSVVLDPFRKVWLVIQWIARSNGQSDE